MKKCITEKSRQHSTWHKFSGCGDANPTRRVVRRVPVHEEEEKDSIMGNCDPNSAVLGIPD